MSAATPKKKNLYYRVDAGVDVTSQQINELEDIHYVNHKMFGIVDF